MFVYLVIGVVVWLQLLANWLPTYAEWRMIIAGAGWNGFVAGIVADLQQLAARFNLWWQGVMSANAARDDLVLVALAAALIWLMAGLTGWLTRRFGRVSLPASQFSGRSVLSCCTVLRAGGCSWLPWV
ncbi:MAG: hypothetical protein IPK16_01010 [Anaerolineales bacterium]|nr:hypothetical protein [Anaerolineales bacterium]